MEAPFPTNVLSCTELACYTRSIERGQVRVAYAGREPGAACWYGYATLTMDGEVAGVVRTDATFAEPQPARYAASEQLTAHLTRTLGLHPFRVQMHRDGSISEVLARSALDAYRRVLRFPDLADEDFAVTPWQDTPGIWIVAVRDHDRYGRYARNRARVTRLDDDDTAPESPEDRP